MSYDLLVIAKKQPKAVHLDAFGGIAGGVLAISGRFQVGGHVLLSDVDDVVVEVDGPSRVEDEDVPDQAAGAIGATGWLDPALGQAVDRSSLADGDRDPPGARCRRCGLRPAAGPGHLAEGLSATRRRVR